MHELVNHPVVFVVTLLCAAIALTIPWKRWKREIDERRKNRLRGVPWQRRASPGSATRPAAVHRLNYGIAVRNSVSKRAASVSVADRFGHAKVIRCCLSR